jgi:tRNA (cytidine/uridine-2'-O-)-methyltransferase
MVPSLHIALYEPDIPQNTGTVLRMAACLGVPVEVIEPCGFVWGGKHMRRSAMDYIDHVDVTRHLNWAAFQDSLPGQRRVLLTTKTDQDYTKFEFEAGDILILGRESAGVPESVHDSVDARLTIPLKPPLRSFNLAAAAAMVTGEALRQLDGFPDTLEQKVELT